MIRITATTPQIPKIQWAQDEKHLWLTVFVPEIEEHEVDLSESELVVEAEDASGAKHSLQIELREFVVARESQWEQTTSTVFVTLKKVHEHFWDRLLWDPTQHRGVVKLDMSRWKDIPEHDEV